MRRCDADVLPARGLVKTYSRPARRVWEDEDAQPSTTKKLRVEEHDRDHDPLNDDDDIENNLESAIRESSATLRSSPERRASATVPESDSLEVITETPPSSPPPLRLTPPPPSKFIKPVFPNLKRKREGSSSALAETDHNSNGVRKSAAAESRKKPRLTQMQIDLGGEVRKACPVCGMEYVPSNAEDDALHKKFHAMNVGGVDLSKGFVREVGSKGVWESAAEAEGYIALVDRRSSATARTQVKKVLEIVNSELGAAEIDDALLWGQVQAKRQPVGGRAAEAVSDVIKDGAEVDRFKVYLHIKGGKCIGVCLAERILEAHRVLAMDEQRVKEKAKVAPASKSSSISVEEKAEPAILGISRVWTSNTFRRKGIAGALLDTVASNFIYGMEIPKDAVAFSQPTESGCRLAETWFEKASGWHVYSEAF